jgi:hypothetical protein
MAKSGMLHEQNPDVPPLSRGFHPGYALPSPEGLTTQVGFIRLAHPTRPNSGLPEFGWSILFVRTFFANRMDCTATRARPSCAV